jgi:hypothetical protein
MPRLSSVLAGVLAGIAGVLALAYLAAAAIGLVPGLDWYHDLSFTRAIAGCPVILGEPDSSFDSPRSFQGDGYSVSRFTLPSALPACMANLGPRLSKYPSRVYYRKDWLVISWRHPPLSKLDSELSSWALGAEAPGLENEILLSLERPSTWYAMRYKGGPTTFGDPFLIQNVDLYVVDPTTHKFYLVNKNT